MRFLIYSISIISFWVILETNKIETSTEISNDYQPILMCNCDTVQQRNELIKFYNSFHPDSLICGWDTTASIGTWYGVGIENCLINCDLCSANHCALSIEADDCIRALDFDGSINPFSGYCFDISPENSCGANNSGNGLHGTIPDTIKLCGLEGLDLSHNNFTGDIPDFYGLDNLLELGMHCNDFSSVPNFSNLPKLKRLFLFHNKITALPNFNNLPELTYLNVHQNEISDTVPFFQQLTQVEELYLFDNHFTGTIPNFETLNNLKTIHLHGNNLTDTIPAFENLPNLKNLWLHSNYLEGTIPAFNGFNQLQLDSNHFTFEDFLPNLSSLATIPSASIVIAPQRKVFADTTIIIPDGCPYILDINVDDTVTTNVYRWEKNGFPFDTVMTDEYNFPIITLDDSGVYKCFITNDSVNAIVDIPLTLETYNIIIDVCISGKDSIDALLCPGGFLVVNGTIYNENFLSGKEVIPNAAANGCDSIIWVNVTYVEEVDVELDTLICTNSIFLEAELPDHTSGVWQSSSLSNIQDLNNPETWVENLSIGENEFVWVLSSDSCFEFDRDTLYVNYEEPPQANSDTYNLFIDEIIEDSNFLSNDLFDISNDSLTILSVPSQGNFITDASDLGNFNFNPGDKFVGELFFQYELCNKHCLIQDQLICDTATVNIIVNYLLDYNKVITPNDDGHNDVFLIKELEENPNDFPNNRLLIYNQWGDVVYSVNEYQNDWRGENQKGKKLPQSTYYFEFYFDEKRIPIQDVIVILK